MTELRKPEAPTPEAFTKLANEVLALHSYRRSEIHSRVRIATLTAASILNGKFAEQKFQAMTPRAVKGAAESLARFCQHFSCDLQACFEACGIPDSYILLPGVQNPTLGIKGILHDTIIDEDAWQKVQSIIQIVGPMTLGQVSDLLETARKNPSPLV